jgi:hypothetical protein
MSSACSKPVRQRSAALEIGGMRQATFLRGIELLSTEVLPQLREELEKS